MSTKITGKINPVPEGFHTITPVLVVQGAAAAIEFYKRAFGAEECARTLGPDGVSIVLAELRIGDSKLLLCDEFPAVGSRSPLALSGSPVTMHLYVRDVDTLWRQALEAGVHVLMPLEDAYWGDRYGKVADPFGHHWSLASRRRDLSAEEIAERAKTAFGLDLEADE
jgi:uncharacterized glyoxalase superfamily protein PhnB